MLITGGMTSGPVSNYGVDARGVTRVIVPVLLLAGRYDYIFPVETRQVPFMDLLGTADEHKHHVIFEAGHLPLPRAELIRETLEWLDRYQGPVARCRTLTRGTPRTELIGILSWHAWVSRGISLRGFG